MLGRGVTEHLRRRDRERLVGTLLHQRRRHERDVGQAGDRAGRILAVAHLVDRRQEHRRGTHRGNIVLARGDLRVLRLCGVELRVEEVDHDLAAGKTAASGLAVDVLRPTFHPVDRPLEQVRRQRAVDIGDHRDMDLLVGDPHVGGLRLLTRDDCAPAPSAVVPTASATTTHTAIHRTYFMILPLGRQTAAARTTLYYTVRSMHRQLGFAHCAVRAYAPDGSGVRSPGAPMWGRTSASNVRNIFHASSGLMPARSGLRWSSPRVPSWPASSMTSSGVSTW